MKTKLSLALLIGLYSNIAIGQESPNNIPKSINQIMPTLVLQRHFNKVGLDNYELSPFPIKINNTWGYTVGIDYQRTTRYGLIWSVGLHYGMQKQDNAVVYKDLTFIDPTASPEALEALKKESLPPDNYALNMSSANLRLQLGYNFKLPSKSLSLQVKAGVSYKCHFASYHDEKAWGVGYRKDGFIHSSVIAEYKVDYGRRSGFDTYSLNDNIYIGLTKKINKSFVQDISVGVELAGIFLRNGPARIEATSRYYDGHIKSIEKYKAPDYSLGVRVAVGLWPKRN